MAVPGLVIGLGGTGQWALTHLKKNLIETYGKIPLGVKLLAFDLDLVDERAIGGIRLEPWEYVCLGDNLRSYVSDIASDGNNRLFPHVRSWFKADDYLPFLPNGEPDVEPMDILRVQSRQLARLAIFRDLRYPPVSKVLARLMDSVQEIQRDTNPYTLAVFLVGSLAGGAGAGMFVDVAHLVRQIAKEQAHMQVNVRGFLVLPDAFGSALPETDIGRRGMIARSFAAMRETRRLSVNFDWDLGYPVHYVAPNTGFVGDPVLAGSIKGLLFDNLYYIDGHRRNFSLNVFPVENGVAPTIADMISALLDENAYGSFEEHTRNLQAVLASRGDTLRVPYCGSIGAYAIVLPLSHIIEGYAHQLSLEALQQILQPAAMDDRTGLPTRLAGDRNAEAGEGHTGLAAARVFLLSSYVVDPSDPTSAVEAPLLIADLVDFVERFTPADMSVVGWLVERPARDWERVFTPMGHTEDILNARRRIEAVLNTRLRTEVSAGRNVTLRERPADRIVRIRKGVRSHKDIYVGAEQKETGQRLGGKYSEALDEYASVHLDRFQRMLEYRIREVLNGRSIWDPVQVKSGKLGYLQEFLEGVSSYLGRGYQVMTRVMEHRRCQGYGRMQAIAAAQNALNEMKANANDTRPIIGKAHKSQDAYLEAEQLLIDIHKVEIMEQAVTDTIKQMQEMVASAKASADGWAQTLGLGQDSLYAALFAGKRQVDADRDKDANVESRLVLGAWKAGQEEDADYERVREYEEIRYRHYAYRGQANQVAAMLADLNWQVITEEKAGKPTFRLGLSLASDASRKPDSLEDSAGKNSGFLLGRARQAFKDAWKDESVLDYLMYVYDRPEALADLIHERSGPLLEHDAEGPIPANYLRAAYGQVSGQADYLRGMLRRLANRSNITDMDRFARLVNSEDRLACTLVHTMDLIELDRMAAYQSGLREYLGMAGEGDLQTSPRALLHCFPAEVNAVQYEEKLPSLNQAVRLLHDDVVLQLEKQDSLRLFLLCWGYHLINCYEFEDLGQKQEVWRLQWEASDECDTGEVWLTRPQRDQTPSFLEALMTFNYVGRDVGHGEDYWKRIEWDRVKSTLEKRYQEHLTARRTAGTLGASDLALHSWLVQQNAPDDDPVWQLMARLDRLFEMDAKLTKMVADEYEHLKAPGSLDSIDVQQQYDLASVFLLILRDGQDKLRRRIHDWQREAWSGLDRP